MPTDLEAVLADARRRVTPDAEERAHLEATVETVLERTEQAVADHAPGADVVHVGSTARDTWLPGSRDVDVFVRFPPETDDDTLASAGLAVGHAVLPAGREQFAAHPYVTGPVDGVDVDVVPCYRLESPTEVRSAVDRTPFHDAYLTDRLTDDLRTEIRLTKAFLTAIGIYGSDLRTRGIGGYLAELLVCEAGSFAALLEAAADWHPPVEWDPADHGRTAVEDPLVVVDPTDPDRNVAAVVSDESLATLQHHARRFLAAPALAGFERPSRTPLGREALEAHLERRGTHPVAIRFAAPDLVDDQLWPQLRKSRRGIVAACERRGFVVNRSTAMAEDGEAAILLECLVASLPAIERHEGPPVAVRDHAEAFRERYADDPDVTGPFIAGDRYVVERERAVRTVDAFLGSAALLEVGLGVHVQKALAGDYEVLAGPAVATLLEDFGTELRAFYEPTV